MIGAEIFHSGCLPTSDFFIIFVFFLNMASACTLNLLREKKKAEQNILVLSIKVYVKKNSLLPNCFGGGS